MVLLNSQYHFKISTIKIGIRGGIKKMTTCTFGAKYQWKKFISNPW
ncbi:unnamed protein product [Onchocerca flexuosa]|uniref:Uncharacterized protein n=1 Tax=Onchocerca flexuosa TaxID=387005 RepID=A0A183HRR0_9BILA|nr:unnamed protein product [Onchocerca flexuosa]